MNTSIVINYEGHNYGDPSGYVQFTRSGDRVFMVVDRRPIGSFSLAEFVALDPLTEV
jgi:hypothetical protein